MFVYPVGVEPFNGRVNAFCPILVLARFAPTEAAVQFGLLFEMDPLHRRFLW